MMKLRTRENVSCAKCGRKTPSHDIVSCGSLEQGYRELCGQCFNTEAAAANGIEGFRHAEFKPVRLSDHAGETHEFYFRVRLFGPLVALDAFELRDRDPSGYRFQVVGKPDEDLFVIFTRMIEKIRRALAVQHLTGTEPLRHIADHRTVRGRIEWDTDSDGELPLLVVDGRSVSWTEFGRMLMSYEGWQFKLSIADKSEEV